MASPSSNATITLLIIDEHAGAAGRVGAALSERLPGVRIVTSASHADAAPARRSSPSSTGEPAQTDEPGLIVWNLADDSPDRIGALGLFLQTQPDAPTVVIVPEYATGLVSVAIQAGAEDAVVRTAGFVEQLAAIVMKHAVLIGARDRRRSSDLDQSGVAETAVGEPSSGKPPRGGGPGGSGGLPPNDWGRVREAVADLQRENRSLREMVSHLRDAANTDALTGLGNTRHLHTRLDELFAASRRYGADLSCLVLDLDGLKAVNDALGHSAGDELLRTTADVIRRCTRRSDVSARAGGDEFVVLLPHTHPDMARLLAGRLQRELTAQAAELSARLSGTRSPLRLTGTHDDPRRTSPVGVSIGVASAAATRVASGCELVAAADRAMYEAKRRGRGQVVVWDTGERAAA